jgi:hypothetical protein
MLNENSAWFQRYVAKNGQSLKVDRSSRLAALKGLISNKLIEDLTHTLIYE